MKHKSLSWHVAFPVLLVALYAQAHDPAEHMKGSEKPDCAVMKDMDHSKMDMNDPVMQAMTQICMDELHQDEAGSNDSHADHTRHDDNGKSESASKYER